jgi:hypothetical protein
MTKIPDYLYAAVTAANRQPRPLHIVGPYSKWPQQNDQASRVDHHRTEISSKSAFLGADPVHA